YVLNAENSQMTFQNKVIDTEGIANIKIFDGFDNKNHRKFEY
ncbi:6463_t:CDS:1, partial [Gigaspora rosea]